MITSTPLSGVVDGIRKRRWNKKEETAKGRPTGKSTQLWLQSIALFFPDKPSQTYDQSSYRLEGIFCTICMEIPEQPLHLECYHLVCSGQIITASHRTNVQPHLQYV